ncbi:tRNA (adenosine(37)-N6)-threonylcarbamoyltransferase complex ATPase subunit type 1 TsaE [Aquisphaera insulae]|uniref:tRNA (adenosine(37)-N6)-threonylcarbamoyltransferase complex ATPase subunit type 1 TsaE n=1 Tax=Aquisphaera insulae TaxID=2712864 RepID=UPI0013EBB959|nr:tRNA (adenosine(37)-N6)-threonylcarbamoyltransferase complex ATPase subunit type 1 TsaE [Aquisphaera insulae]
MKVNRTVSGLEVELASEQDTRAFGEALAGIVEPGTVIGLIGPLGAGKTQLARAVAEELGADPAAIASPTFVLIHEYEGRIPVYHFDVYRLNSREAFEDLGPADYWDAGGVCLVEWADRFPGLLPDRSWTIRIEPREGDRRHLVLEVPPGDSGRLDAFGGP